MVPLNLDAETPLSLKPHFLHGVAALSFWVPQLGQNTRATSTSETIRYSKCLPK
jgi:hypothetical protein